MVISMDRWKGKVAVVTGASAGIGAAIAEQLVSAGLIVVGLARRKERIDELAKKLKDKPGKLHSFQADISKEEDIVAAFKWIKENVGPVHVLVNNAGLARSTTLIDGETKLWREVMDTNVLGLSIATREAIKDMRANKVDGHVIHINSVVGHIVANFPRLNVYSASKFAVKALTETLRQELNSIGSKIKITSISPGRVDTEFATAAGQTTSADFKKVASSFQFLKAEDVADCVTYALSTPPHVQIHELMLRSVGQP